MKVPLRALAMALLCASCTDFPRDPQGTLDRIRSEGSYRVGLVAPLSRGGGYAELPAFLDRVSAAASASPQITTGDSEPLLLQLEEGELDLVVGRFDKKSPWATKVEIGPALRIEKHGKAELHLAPAMRNGENAWIALIEAQARDSAGKAR